MVSSKEAYLGQCFLSATLTTCLMCTDSPIHMFADYTKIFRQMTAQSDQVTLQTDLRQLEARTRKWQLRFNEEKCKVMHLGQYNHHYDYTITSGGKIPAWGRPQMKQT